MTLADVMRMVVLALVIAVSVVATVRGDERVKGMIGARGARALVLSRGKLVPPKPTPTPNQPCCNECKGTGKWKPDGHVVTECPCDPSCKCKAKGAAACPSGKCPTNGAKR